MENIDRFHYIQIKISTEKKVKGKGQTTENNWSVHVM